MAETSIGGLSTERVLGLGRFHLAALAESEETRGVRAAFEPAHLALETAYRARLEAEDELVTPRVRLRFAEKRAEEALRRLANAAADLDGKRGGAIYNALFPSTLTAETSPRAAAQRDAVERVRQRLESQSTASALRDPHLTSLATAITSMTAALDARKTAAEAVGVARAREDAAHDDFSRAYDASAGELRRIFPRDRAQQDLYFDSARRRGGAEDEPEGPPVTT
jgi:hypothetical protein